MAGEVEIRRARPGDEALLAQVAEDVFDRAIEPARLSAFLADPGHLMVVAVQDGVVVGQVRGMVHRAPDEADQLYVDNLGVDPSVQRRGIARALMQAILAAGRELGCSGAWLATETGNGPARALYGGLGFEEQRVAYFERKL